MSFIVNEDMFGRYCRIPTGTSGDMHTYKIVSRIDSNSYCDVPLTSTSKKILHNKIVPVLLVIHCGVDESKVQRVALSDCEIIPSDVAEVVRCKDCKYLMFSDFYGECSRGYFGIVLPDDYCSRGVRKDGKKE